MCVRAYVRDAHVRVMEAENSITLTIYIYCRSVNMFIALGCHSEMIMGFHEYTYQDHEYIIRTMNTMHAQSPAIHSTCN